MEHRKMTTNGKAMLNKAISDAKGEAEDECTCTDGSCEYCEEYWDLVRQKREHEMDGEW